MIDVCDFKKAYGSTLAVRGLTFAVRPHQVWGLVGHNGAGKTTTMRAIAGLLPPSHGALRVAQFDVGTSPIEAKRNLAYLSDDPQLFNALTVGEHMRFTASAYQLADYRQRAAELLEFFELAERIDTPAEDLSRGMRQKLAICCAYLHDPPAILFDEPFTGLDPRAIRRLKQSIREKSAGGTAIVVSSHLLAMVEDLCTHFLVLAHGSPTFCGTHQELFARCNQDGDEKTLEEVFFEVTDMASQTCVASEPLESPHRAAAGDGHNSTLPPGGSRVIERGGNTGRAAGKRNIVSDTTLPSPEARPSRREGGNRCVDAKARREGDDRCVDTNASEGSADTVEGFADA